MMRPPPARFLAVALALGLSFPAPSSAQHGRSPAVGAASHDDRSPSGPAELPGPPSHDPDRDGALIGGVLGALGLGLYWSRWDCCGSIGSVYGVVIGGLAGLVVGGLIDASDAFESGAPDSTPSAPPPDSLPSATPPGDSLGAPGEDPGSAHPSDFGAPAIPGRPGLRGHIGAVAAARAIPGGAVLQAGLAPLTIGPSVRPASRRADLYGAIVGAILLGSFTHYLYCGIHDGGACGLSLKAIVPGMLIGGVLGAGIGSALAGEDEEQEEGEGEPQESEKEPEDRR